jgi:hypothetical protein
VFGIYPLPTSGDNLRRIKLTSKVSRVALIAAVAVGASGLVAVPAADAAFQTGTGLVNQPIVTGASQITPESAVITGAVDTGGYNQPNNNVTTSSAATAGGYSVVVTPGSTWAGGVTGTGYPVPSTSSSITIDGIPTTTPATNGTPAPTFSGVWVEYDPVADYVTSGDTPGPETQIAPEEDIDTSTAPYTPVPSVTIGGYPAANAENSGQTPLTPGTAYYYWIVQQTDETTAATTIDAFDPVDLYDFLDGSTTTPPSASGAISGAAGSNSQLTGTATGTGGAAAYTSTAPLVTSGATENDFPAWQAGTGAFGATAANPTGVGAANAALFNGSTGLSGVPNLATLANPDYSCQADYKLINGGPFAVNSPGEPWASYTSTSTTTGGIVDGNTSGVSSNSSYNSTTGTFNYAPAQLDEQPGACADYLGSIANQNYQISSSVGEFTTPKLGDVKFGAKATLSGKKLTETVQNKSALVASGTVDLTDKIGKKTVTLATGTFKVAPKDTATFTLKLTAKALRLIAAPAQTAKEKKAHVTPGMKTITAKIVYTSNTDQPTTSKKVKF